jgi:hypothetical protein
MSTQKSRMRLEGELDSAGAHAAGGFGVSALSDGYTDNLVPR